MVVQRHTSISSPTDGAVVTMPTDIVGTATDTHFLRYRLEFSEVDAATSSVIGSGTAPVVNGVLGRLDPTLLENGLYRVRLVVEDVNGQVAADERVYRVAGEAKVGLFALSFIDLQVPVSGIPITVVRSYDSRVKTSRDFGIGWTLHVKSGKYQNNRPPGQGWIINDQPFLGTFLPCIGGVSETRSHLTEVRLSERESYTFALTLTGGNLGITGACEATASFRFIDGTTPGATLEILDGTSVIYVRGGADEVLQMNAFLDGTSRVYDPQRVRLITIDGRKIDFDRTAGITRIEDLNGNALSITAGGITHSSGKSVSFVRDALGRISLITDPSGKRLSYAYNANGDLAEFIDQAGNRTTFSYDTRHNLVEIHDPVGNRAVRSEYDSDGRLTAVIDARGNRTEFTHNLSGRQEVIRDQLGRLTVHEYDPAGNITATVDALGNRRVFTFDSRGNQLTERDPLGRVASRQYDAADNLVTTSDFDGNTTVFTYNSRRQVLTVTDPEGQVTRKTYDSRGNLIQTINPEGGISRFSHDAAGNVIVFTDAVGSTTRWTYDAAGNQVSQTNGLGHISTSTYDAAGNMISEQQSRTVAGGRLEAVNRRSTYDSLNRPTSRIDALGNTLQFTYTSTSQAATSTDARGHTVRIVYDAAGNLVETLLADGSRSAASYDSEARVIAQTDRDGHTSTFEYDALGRQVAGIHPDHSSISRTYDAVGRVLAAEDELGNRTSFSYEVNWSTADVSRSVSVAANVLTSPPKRNETLIEANAGIPISASWSNWKGKGAPRSKKKLSPEGSERRLSNSVGPGSGPSQMFVRLNIDRTEGSEGMQNGSSSGHVAPGSTMVSHRNSATLMGSAFATLVPNVPAMMTASTVRRPNRCMARIATLLPSTRRLWSTLRRPSRVCV